MADNVAITAGAGTNIATDDVGGVQYQKMKIVPGSSGVAGPEYASDHPLWTAGAGNAQIALNLTSASIGVLTAAIYLEKVSYLVPTNYVFQPVVGQATVTTTGSKTLWGSGKRLGTYNTNTLAYTPDQALTTPDFYDRLMVRVTTILSAAADSLTLTYTDQGGATGNTSGAAALGASAPVGNWYEVANLAAGDVGATAVTAVATHSGTPTGIVEFWGLRTLYEFPGAVATTEMFQWGNSFSVLAGETIWCLIHAAATTAQVRSSRLHGVQIPTV